MVDLGIVVAFIWLKVIYSPEKHPTVNTDELKLIKAGGALTNMGEKSI